MAQNDFISGFLDAVGKVHDIKRRKQKDEWDEEDRVIEKDLLSHRLRTLKINEKIQARTAAMENASLLQGQPEDNFPWDGSTMREGPSPFGAKFGNFEFPVKEPPPVAIPGIDELGVPGVTAHPQSLEEVMRQIATDLRTKARSRGYELSRGETVAIPGATESDPYERIEGQPWTAAPRAPTVQRSVGRRQLPNGRFVEWDEFYDPATDTTRKSPERAVIPRASGGGGGTTNADGGTANMLSASEQAGAVRMFMKGTPLELNPKSAIGLRNLIALDKAGMDIPTAMADQTNYGTYLKRLGENGQADALEAANAIEFALNELDEMMKDPKTKSADIETITNVIRAYAPLVRRPQGNSATDKAMAEAESFFKPGWWSMFQSNEAAYRPMVTNLRKQLQYRVRSIRGVFQPVGTETGPSAPPRPDGNPEVVDVPEPDVDEPEPLPDSAPGLPEAPPQRPPQRIKPVFTDAQITAALTKAGKRVNPANVQLVKTSEELQRSLGLIK